MQPFPNQPHNDLRKLLSKNTLKVLLKQGSTSLTDIEELFLISLTPKILQALKQHCKSLKHLRVVFCVAAFQVEKLSKIQNLTHLTIFFHGRLSEETLNNLKNLQKIQRSNYSQFDNTDFARDMKYLSILHSKIKSIRGFTQLKESMVMELRDIKQLQEISFNLPTEIKSLRLLTANLSYLKFIHIGSADTNDQHLQVISENLNCLEALSLAKSKITSKGLIHLLKHSEHLITLNIRNCKQLTSKDLIFVITNFPKLTDLSIDAQLCSQEVLLVFADKLPLLKCFELFLQYWKSHFQYKKLCEKFIEKMLHLEKLALKIRIDLGLIKFLIRLPQLNHIEWLQTKERVNNSEGFYLSKLKSIRYFKSYSTNFQDAGVMKIFRNIKGANIYLGNEWENQKRKFVTEKLRRNVKLFELTTHMGIKI